ncbi:membrane protein insertase YidC [Segniliparus rugosus]|uniref:Membrane protein insertase YidC n=1 Tax=Segniliparus rugosus (strain ATCC BAA-974 / DSM 45345 / CCUG 50838 / CIP 108380 / JCM 13579 / CDC 945) TaxID=679197 RepID=E5XV92_SEGRC|nr:membrane protein insertase YidC [Segniliparus rugosus]EFV11705.1 YidC/Oxa1 family membrane protein insertase [Segniliparus rugosus ATCC BAA-974]
MLDFVYYPVSGVLWLWHWVFSQILGPESGFGWALSVVALVCTLRALLYAPAIRQIRFMRKMQEIQPQMKAIQTKYAKDRQRQALEMQKLQKEHGFNPLLGCLPMLLQIPVFIGLYHVLSSFNRTAGAFFSGGGSMTPEQNRNTKNYVFSPHDVQSFLESRFFGVPLSSYITEPAASFNAFIKAGSAVDFQRWQIAAVAIPLMLIASVATHMNSRASLSRQPADVSEQPQAAMMRVMSLWVFPLGVLIFGWASPIALLLYWVSNNAWTYGQQHLVFRKIDREDEEKKRQAVERRAANAPKPGAKPVRKKAENPAAHDSQSE